MQLCTKTDLLVRQGSLFIGCESMIQISGAVLKAITKK